MSYTTERLRKIYDRTDGRCHICAIKLSFANYANAAGRAAWEVEHSRPRANGGSDHGNNLYPACISCNRSKGTVTSRTARRWNGSTRAPLSKQTRQKIRAENATVAGIFGGVLGAPAGPAGIAMGAAVGAWVGRELFDAPK